MINIEIIEDNRNDEYKLESLIKDLFEKEHIEYNVRWHNTIIDDMDYFQNIDILFLDIEIGADDGIEYGKKLRNTNPEILMIITSNFPQYLIDGYTIEAKRYFLKPIDPTIFDVEMKNVLKTSFKQSFGFLDHKISRSKIKYNQIFYVDFQDRVTLLHLKDGQVLKTPYTLKYWIDKLSDKGFSQPYRSYVVNLYQVSGFSKDKKDLVLLNDEKIPISKHFRKSFEEDYHKFLGRII